MLAGGSFTSGFASGAVVSGIGHLMSSESYDISARVAASSFSGGITAWLTGGDFVRGALQGLSIAIFNEVIHDKLYSKNGEYRYNFGKSVVCRKRILEIDPEVFEAMYNTNTWIDCIAFANMEKGGNSTLGSNWKFYFHKEGTRGSYGNQYVTRTIKLAERGAYFSKYTKAWGPVGLALNSGKMLGAGMADYNQYQKTGEVNLDNTIEAATEITVSWAGGWLR